MIKHNFERFRLKMEAVNTDSSSTLSLDVIGDLSSFLTFNFEPTGKWFEQYTYLRHLGDAEEVVEESSSESEDEAVVEDTAEFLAYLHSLDPKEWKEQDHYKVLGLEHLRFKSTPHQIKKVKAPSPNKRNKRLFLVLAFFISLVF